MSTDAPIIMDDELTALHAEIENSTDASDPPAGEPDADTSHDDNDIHLAMQQSLDDSVESVTSPTTKSPPPPPEQTELAIHADTLEEVIIETVDHEINVTIPLYSPAKAVLNTSAEPNEQDEMFHEEEVMRVLTTLESAKRQEPLKEKPVEEEPANEIVDEEYMDVIEEIELEATKYESDPSETISSIKPSNKIDDPSELARRQLENIQSIPIRAGRPRKNPAAPGKTGQAKQQQPQAVEKKPMQSILIKNMKSQVAQRIEANTYVTPNNKPKFESAGTIEIPKELILGSEELHSSVLLNAGTPLKNEDLLAILEGSDDETVNNGSHLVVAGKTVFMNKETEKELAMKQILSLPPKPKGRRPKPKPPVDEVVVKKETAASKKASANELVNSLVMDWSGGSDSESKAEDDPAEKPPKKLKPLPKKSPTVINTKAPSPVAPVAFKRSRIIKKKIIWDPDAPETAVSYASLIQPSAAFIKKTQSMTSATAKKSDAPPPRILNKIPALQQQQEAAAAAAASSNKSKEVLAKKRVQSTPSPNAMKKRKVSEIEKLLGDEGAANMLNALKQENNNTDSSEQDTSPDGVARKDADSPSPNGEEKYNPRQPRIKRPQTPLKVAQPSVAAKKEPVKRKKAANATASNSWDYIYSNRDDDALIIRRRSNSSYSSSASNTRLSIDGPVAPKLTKTGKVPGKLGRPRTKESASFEFAKPSARKSVQSSDTAESTILMDIRPKADKSSPSATNRRPVRTPTTSEDGSDSPASGEIRSPPSKDKKPAAKTEATAKQLAKATKSKTVYQEIHLKQWTNVAHIVLEPFSDKLENVFTVQVKHILHQNKFSLFNTK